MKKFQLIVLSSLVVTCGVFATPADENNANLLAGEGIIVDQSSNPANYRFGDKILRQEIIAIALKMKGVELPKDYTCKKYFSDVTANDWVCRAVELAADNGIISRSNKYANPGMYITRAEALAIISNIVWFRAHWASIYFNFETTQPWQRKVFNRFYDNNITPKDSVIKTSYYPESQQTYISSIEFYPNSFATRNFVFDLVKEIYVNHKGSLGDIVTDNDSIKTMLQGTWVMVDYDKITSTHEMDFLGFNFGDWKYNEVEWSSYEFQSHFKVNNGFLPDSIEWAIDVNGVKFIKWSVWWLCWDTIYATYTKTSVITFYFGSCSKDTFIDDVKYLNFKTDSFNFWAVDLLKIYYSHLSGKNFYSAYSFRFPKWVSEDTFIWWYKNVETVTFREDTLKSLGDNIYEFLVDMTENGIKSTYKVKSKINFEKFTIDNISSVKQ